MQNKSILKRFLIVVCMLCCALALIFGFSGCSGDAKGITSAAINDKGELVITYTDGTTENLGKVTGDKGDKGDKGDQGEQGEQGEASRANKARRVIKASRVNKARRVIKANRANRGLRASASKASPSTKTATSSSS